MQPYLPGAQFMDLGPDGGPFDEMGHPKGCLHTTEGTSLAGAESAFRAYPPHLGYDPRYRISHQYIRLDRYAYALKGAESDDEFVIQIEIVGFARDTHNWPTEWYRNIGEDIIKPLREAVGIPNNYQTFYGEDSGFVLASPSSPIRLSNDAFRKYTGWVGHQHIPAPDEHWDPGKFRILEAINYSNPKKEDMAGQYSGKLPASKYNAATGEHEVISALIPIDKGGDAGINDVWVTIVADNAPLRIPVAHWRVAGSPAGHTGIVPYFTAETTIPPLGYGMPPGPNYNKAPDNAVMLVLNYAGDGGAFVVSYR